MSTTVYNIVKLYTDGCTEYAAKKLVPMYGTLERYTPLKLVQVGCAPGMKLMDPDEAFFLCHQKRWIGGAPKCIRKLKIYLSGYIAYNVLIERLLEK